MALTSGLHCIDYLIVYLEEEHEGEGHEEGLEDGAGHKVSDGHVVLLPPLGGHLQVGQLLRHVPSLPTDQPQHLVSSLDLKLDVYNILTEI